MEPAHGTASDVSRLQGLGCAGALTRHGEDKVAAAMVGGAERALTQEGAR